MAEASDTEREQILAGASALPDRLWQALERGIPFTLMGVAVLAAFVYTALWVLWGLLERNPALVGPRAEGWLFLPLLLGLNAVLLWVVAVPVQALAWRLARPLRLALMVAAQLLAFVLFYTVFQRISLRAGSAFLIFPPPLLFALALALLERFKVETLDGQKP